MKQILPQIKTPEKLPTPDPIPYPIKAPIKRTLKKLDVEDVPLAARLKLERRKEANESRENKPNIQIKDKQTKNEDKETKTDDKKAKIEDRETTIKHTKKQRIEVRPRRNKMYSCKRCKVCRPTNII